MVTSRMRENKIEIDFVLIRKEHWWSSQIVKAIPWEYQLTLVVVGIDENR